MFVNCVCIHTHTQTHIHLEKLACLHFKLLGDDSFTFDLTARSYSRMKSSFLGEKTEILHNTIFFDSQQFLLNPFHVRLTENLYGITVFF